MNTGAIVLMVISITVVLVGTALLSFYLNKKSEGTWAVQKTPLLVTIGTTFATAIGGGVLTYHIGLAINTAGPPSPTASARAAASSWSSSWRDG